MIRKLTGLFIAMGMTFSLCSCQGVQKDGGYKASGNSDTSGKNMVYDEKEIGSNAGLKSPGKARINSKNQLMIFDRNGEFVTLDKEGKALSRLSCVLPGQLVTFDLDSQDNIYAVVREAVSKDETSQKVCVIDSAGKITNTYELGKFKTNGSLGKMPFVLDMALDGNGNINVATLSGIIVLDKTGKSVRKIGTDGYYSIDTDQDNNIITVCIGKGKRALEKLDSNTGKSIWEVNLNEVSSGEVQISAGTDTTIRYNNTSKSIYIMDENAVYNFDGQGKLAGLVLDFKNYMLLTSGNNLADMNIDQKGNIFITTRKDSSYEIYRYDVESGAHEAKARKTIAFAVPVKERWLEVAALKFQKVNPEYKVDIKAYEQDKNADGNYENYIKTLNTELLTGKGPDILYAGCLSYEKYIQKNMLADLSMLMANDKSFDISKYYSNIFDALKHEGRLYTLPASISFDVISANKKILDQDSIHIDDNGWTWEEFRDIGEKLTENEKGRSLFMGTSYKALLYFMLKGNSTSFVNEYEKKASFDSKEFTDILDMVKEYGDSKIAEDVIANNMNLGDMDGLEKGTVIFNPLTLSDYTTYAFLSGLYKDPFELLKFPSADSGKGNVFNSDALFSINANSKNREVAWEFLKFLLSDEVQSEELTGFAVNRESLKKTAQKAVDMTNSGGLSFMVSTKDDDKPKTIEPRPLKQKDIDYINSFIENMNKFNRVNMGIKKIISEETSAFFSGQKSAAEVAVIIQEKVNIYLGE